MMKRILLASAIVGLFSAGAFAQPNPPPGLIKSQNLADVPNKPLAIINLGAAAVGTGAVLTANPTLTAAQFNQNCPIYTVNATSLNIQMPLASTLQANGGCLFVSNPSAFSVNVTPNAADNINGGTTGAALALPAGAFRLVTTDGVNKLFIPTGSVGGTSFGPSYQAGRTYWMGQDVIINTAAVNGEIEWYVFKSPVAITVGSLGAGVQTTSAGGNFSVAIYACDSNLAATGAPLATTGSLSTASAGTITGAVNSSVPYALSANTNYCVGVNTDNTTVKFADVAPTGTYTNAMFGVVTASHLYTSGALTKRSTTQPYASGWPTNPTTTEAGVFTAVTPIPVMTISSVP